MSRKEQFVQKALSALVVAGLQRNHHPNSSANRAYYAVHNACNGLYGDDFPKEHGAVTKRTVLDRLSLDADDGQRIWQLYRTRRIADYEPVDVSPEAAAESWQEAQYLIHDRLKIERPK